MSAIFTSLSPNVKPNDLLQVVKTLLKPWTWQQGRWQKKLLKHFQTTYPKHQSFFFDSGRSSLDAILKTLNLQAGDEILLQALTCIVVPNPIINNKLTPIYIDIDPHTYNMDPQDLQKKITKRTKAILIQHTFGYPAAMLPILQIAKQHKLLIIEDCAHSLGATYQQPPYENTPIGSLSHAAFFSFGRDKMISSVYGGCAIIKSSSQALQMQKYHQQLPYPSRFWSLQQLLHPLIFALALPLYHYQIGKLIIILSQKLGLLSKAVYPCEKKAQCHPTMPKRFPNSLARLTYNQLKQLPTFNQNRQELIKKYEKKLLPLAKNYPELTLPYQKPNPKAHNWPLLRYTIQIKNPQQLHKLASQNKILLGNWYNSPLIPSDSDPQYFNYHQSLCPQAEKIAPFLINLPTSPRTTSQDLDKIIHIIQQYLETNQTPS